MKQHPIMIVTEAAAGGVQTHLQLIIPQLIKKYGKGKVLLVISPKRVDPTFSRQIRNLKDADCEVIFLPMRRSPNLHDFKVFHELKTIIRNFKPRIIHSHAAKAGFLCRWLARSPKYKNISFVHTPHSFFFQGFKGFKQTLGIQFERYLAPLAHFFFISQSEKMLIDQYEFEPQSIQLGLNALPPENANQYQDKHEAYKKLRLNPDHFHIFMMSRFTTKKNHDFVFKIISQLPDKLKIQTRILLFGDGSLKAKLKKQAATLGIEDQLKWIGFKENSWKFLSICDLFLQHSSYEGLSYSQLEAIQYGCPLLVSDGPGNQLDQRLPNVHITPLLQEKPFMEKLSQLIEAGKQQRTPYINPTAFTLQIESLLALYESIEKNQG